MQCGDISKGERKQIKEMPSQPESQGATWCLFHPLWLQSQVAQAGSTAICSPILEAGNEAQSADGGTLHS